MGMRLYADNIELGYNSFAQTCEALGLPKPKCDAKTYTASISKEAFLIYKKTAWNIYENLRTGGTIGWHSFRFMEAWTVIGAIHSDWHYKKYEHKDVNLLTKEEWEDYEPIVFG